ncbi:MAG TPA: FHA domain-containing protein [Myxococcota bacterium]|nr:FHA domain-containing protein [Myxococcota bacterium]HRY93526.1 FHA domain-containing protein [Myxococcota bacterium]HSA20547.1 FHA domain-containing protein [Myxococcota bacterium]
MSQDIRSRRRRRPVPAPDEEGGSSEHTTDEELEAVGGQGGPIHRELSRRGLAPEGGGPPPLPTEEEDTGEFAPHADLSDPDADALPDSGALVFGEAPPGDAGATFVGELPAAAPATPADKTAILNMADVTNEPVPVLTIETGDGQSDVEIVKERFVIGRSPECDVVLPDQLVSRQHAVIEKQDDAWHLVDQKSGNGTFLNDKRITDEPLYDGDEIHIGDARIVFTAPGGGGPRSPRQNATAMLEAVNETGEGTNVTGHGIPSPKKKKRKKMLMVCGVLVVLIGVLGIAKKMSGPSQAELDAAAEAEAAAAAAAEEEAALAQAATDFEEVKKLVGENKWGEAQKLLAGVFELLPEDEDVLRYKKTIDGEVEAERAVGDARAKLDEKNYEGAIAALTPVLAAESSSTKTAQELKVQAEEGLRTDRTERARTALAEKRYEEAQTTADEILRSFPDDPVASDIKRKAEAALRRPVAPPPCVGKGCKKPKVEKPPPVVKSQYLLAGQCLDLYRANKIDEALAQASSSGVSQDGIKSLREFQQHAKNGLGMANNPGQAEQAIKMLARAIELDRKLGGGKGEVTEKVKGTLGKVYFLRGVDAHTSNKYPLAYDSYTLALKYKPDLKQAEDRIKKLEVEAKKLFETAYVIKATSPEKAISTCQTVTQMVNKSNPYYAKCKKMIQSIQGGGDEGDSAEEF